MERSWTGSMKGSEPCPQRKYPGWKTRYRNCGRCWQTLRTGGEIRPSSEAISHVSRRFITRRQRSGEAHVEDVALTAIFT
jgi:hypothetical protein